MAQQFFLDLKDVRADQQAATAAEILLDSIFQDNVLKKQLGKDFLNKIQRNLQDEKISAQVKFYNLSIFKYFEPKNKTAVKLYSLLSGHTLFNYLIDIAKSIDPKKAVSDKGKNIFPDSKQYGVKFMRLLLESLKFWSQKFAQTSNKEPSKFRKIYKKLAQEDKVNFPDSYIYYEQGGNNNQQKVTPGDPSKYAKQQQQSNVPKTSKAGQQKIQTKPTQSKYTPSNQVSGSNQQKQLKGEIRFVYNKIQEFIGKLQDGQDEDQISKQIVKSRHYFQAEQKKWQNSNILNSSDEQTINIYLQVNQFLNVQQDSYEKYFVGKNNLKQYINAVFIGYESIFQNQPVKKQQPKPVKSQIKQNNSSLKNDKPQKDKYSSQNNYQNSKASVKQSIKQEKPSYNSRNNDRQEDEDRSDRYQKKQIKDGKLKSFFDSHLANPGVKSKSGFKALKQSLQKQKKQIKPSQVRGKSPHNVNSSMSRSKFNASTVSKMKINNIFTNPPNPNVGPKRYNGTVVSANYQLQDIVYTIKKDQGMKRFKISNLKSRALLFQNQHIQIGYKGEPIYDQIKQYPEILQFQLFIGNKLTQELSNVEVIFQGDQKSLVYSNPEKIQDTISAGQQAKFDVVIIPCSQIYGFTNMCVNYKNANQTIKVSCALPSSILKFVQYEKPESYKVTQFQRSASICFQTQKFSLSHYFPPKKISHYIEELIQFSDYSNFAENGSQADYELATFMSIKDNYEALLKIIIRPDLNVILQLHSQNGAEQAQKQYKLYLQTLLMVLKQAR